jgi:glycosyltransferase involved in cell wall biosynthesis
VNILVVNWQDRLNPLAGGAEIHIHEIFGRLVRRGHSVTLLASGWPGCTAREEVDGIDVRRVGSRYSFSFAAVRGGRRLLERERFDVVVEALNKVPVFTPRWSRVPTVLIVHHLFGTSAFQEASAPLAAATWLMERPVPRVYRGVPVQAISHSTAADLVERGLRSEDIRVIHPGVDLEFYAPSADDPRFELPTFLYLGRLKRYKRIDLILHALAAVRADGLDARLVIAGRGESEPNLRALADRLGIGLAVQFAGFVDEEKKRALFRRAWANVFVSPKEGWGITNLEAAACGTATLASDSPGLRESVVHQRTGLLVPHGDVRALAAGMRALAGDRDRTEQLGRGALEFARSFTWDSAAQQTEEHLRQVAGASRPPTRLHSTVL